MSGVYSNNAYGPTQYLFNRDWSVQIVPIVQSGKDAYGNPQYNLSGQGVLYAKQPANQVGSATNGALNNLRIVFDIDKTSEGQSNRGKLEIYNLNAQSRKSFQKGSQVILSAGYSGLIKKIWQADILSSGVSVERRDSDIVTIFEGAESGRNIEQNIFFKSYPAGTFFSQMINDIAAVMNVSLSTIIGIDDFAYNQPVSFIQTCKGALYQLTYSNGLEWNIQNDELYVYPSGGCITNQAIQLASGLDELGQTTDNTGLIGIPFTGMTDGITKFQALLNPDIFPGSLVELVSENVNGFYIVRRAHYKGDSHGHDWNIDCESYPNDKVSAQQISQNSVTNQAFQTGSVA